ncbi:MAG TPA: patatin-like phospholipase family protein [Xanthobacteraceae bacterium]|nr:patatin-like phospholipase family protein [Xanthobacteraceae bacterium]
MAFDTNVPPGQLQFDQILQAEIQAINQRRRFLGRKGLVPGASEGKLKTLDAVGLALSGGGVRSASFSLGVLQALNHHDVLRNIDYLSTVSGGGYMGSSLTTTMTCTNGEFVFGNTPKSRANENRANESRANESRTNERPANKRAASEGGAIKSNANPGTPDISDTAAVGHLRNYSNYLIPAGGRDVATGVAIVARGLVANLAWVLGPVLILAAITILCNPSYKDLGCPDILGYPLCERFPSLGSFGLSISLMLLGLLLFFVWALYRSFSPPNRSSEFRTRLPMLAAAYLVLIAVMFFIELQPFFLKGMFEYIDDVRLPEGEAKGLTTLVTILTPLAAIVTLFRQHLAAILKATNTDASASAIIANFAAKAIYWAAGAAVPLLIWVAYLYLSYWGMIDNLKEVPGSYAEPPAVAELVDPPATVGQLDRPRNDPQYCTTDGNYDHPQGEHTPRWMIKSATWLAYSVFCPAFKSLSLYWRVTDYLFTQALVRPMVVFYATIGFAFLLLAGFFKPNANSLHRLYRDRLSKAFLFDPAGPAQPTAAERNQPSLDQGRDFPEADHLLMSGLSSQFAPYHLINASLNLQGSDYANRRGRNADFFLFSSCFVGSEATGYAPTPQFETTEPNLDLATAMAISGAAVSSNMGSQSVRPLRPTLTLLNVRLGYWIKNPRFVGPDAAATRSVSILQRLNNLRHAITPFLWSEITGRLYENSDEVYLTDGGHIENLGVYELLKRRCKLIIVVDAEADPTLTFPSFIALQRYARIDLGVELELPWHKIQASTSQWMGTAPGGDGSPRVSSNGPHAAIGSIDYGDGARGWLLYIKSSLTGDERDYVRNYARRHRTFPHETTGDQFFSEEQFEVYRALGFHATHGLLSGKDALEVHEADTLLHLNDDKHQAPKQVSAALRGEPRPS